MRKRLLTLIILQFFLGCTVGATTLSAAREELLTVCFEKVAILAQTDTQQLVSIATKTAAILKTYAPDEEIGIFLSRLLDYIDEQGAATEVSSDETRQEDYISLPATQTGHATVPYQVLKVIDGDTIDIDYQGTAQSVRLIGIDAPESTTTRYGYQECFGEEARTYLGSLLDGERVTISPDPTQDSFDKYGRMLAYIFLGATNINEQLIREGYAREYTYQKAYQQQISFKNAQLAAQRQQAGLRSSTTCQGERKPVENNSSDASAPPTDCPQDVYCSDLTTCEQAHYYLTVCHLTRLDSDGDGIPCEALCENKDYLPF